VVNFYILCTSGNGNKHSTESYKIYKFTLTVSSIAAMVYAVRDDRDRRLHAVRSVGAVRYCSVLSWHLFWKTKTIELAVCNFHRKAPNVCLFNFC